MRNLIDRISHLHLGRITRFSLRAVIGILVSSVGVLTIIFVYLEYEYRRLPPGSSPDPARLVTLAYVPTMYVDKHATVTLEIAPARDATTATLTLHRRYHDVAYDYVQDTAPVYPIMDADLQAPTFLVQPTTYWESRRVLSPDLSTSWIWTVAPRTPGLQDLTVELTGIVDVTEESQLPQSAWYATFSIEVLPKPPLTRLLEAAIERFDIVALAAAIAATLTAVAALLHQTHTVSSLTARVEHLERTLPPPQSPAPPKKTRSRKTRR
jgi:hypothetical protein